MENSSVGIRINDAGDLLKDLRDELGLSQDGLAKMIGSKRPRISEYENNLRSIPMEVVDKLADALEKPREALLLSFLQKHYPALADTNNELGRATVKLLKEAEEMRTRGDE